MAERERVARDLHDVVAHHVSAIALTAEGARGLVGTDYNTVRKSLGSIHTTSATALDEMRRMVALLRTDADQIDSPLRLADLASSIVQDDSLTVVVNIAEDTLEPPAELVAAVSRIVQEAVTNARRHALNVTTVTIDVSRDAGELLVTVIDDGRPSMSRSGSGYGIAGMRERVDLLGGRFHAGPRDVGGWIVEAGLPMGQPK